ncbi:MAG: tetratricopeptide repeat protein [Planctomycetaceae bacterium]|nr:tetratricopeptide repeat protein [Planctomycetaceae bacterium]
MYRTERIWPVLLVLLAAAAAPGLAQAERLDELPLDRWKNLREVERYQLNIAEKYYWKDKNYKVAAAEYEKFLTLYERSDGAPYAQLKWSQCLVQLRQLNTAIKDGFQSVVDYWPESPEAVVASYFIGNTYKEMGELSSARRAFRKVLEDYSEHPVAVYALNDLVDIAWIENDEDARVRYWKVLTFDTKRTKETEPSCLTRARQLAAYYFNRAAVAEGLKALEVTCKEEELPRVLVSFQYPWQYDKDRWHTRTGAQYSVSMLTTDEKTRAQGQKLADLLVAWLREQIPADTSTEELEQAVRQRWYDIAMLRSYALQDEEVLKTYQQVEKQFGTDDELLGKMAEWMKSRGKYDEARVVYRRFADPVQGQANIGYSYRQQGNYAQAVVEYRKAAALDNENPAKWLTEVANNWRYANKWNEAIATYMELMQVDLERVDQWRYESAVCHQAAGRYKEAIGVYRQCENFPSNYQKMAECYRALKQPSQAVVLYRQIAGGSEAHAPWAMIQIGYTWRDAGQREDAINALQAVCRKFPKHQYGSEAHAVLQRDFKITVTLGGGTDE